MMLSFQATSPVQSGWLHQQQSPQVERKAREQPLFTTKAHVFQIDPETKKNWVPVSKTAVSVSYYYDTTRDTYRIISVDGSKAIVNSTITPTMTFTKTSQKFGQWSDSRANTVYGLGFTSESELSKFIEKFKDIKELTRTSALQKNTEVNGTTDNHLPPQPQPQSPGRQVFHQRTSSWSSSQSDSNSLRERRNSYTQGSSSTSTSLPPNTAEGQLKYENDRLKLALAQSSSNAKKWEVELQTLKNNNARLTAALQESTANVEEWKKQLATYKEEGTRMKKKVLQLESSQMTADQTEELKQEVKTLSEQLVKLREESSRKQEEISKLKREVSDFSAKETNSTALQARIQVLEEENHSLSIKVQDLQRLLQDCRMTRDSENREILSLQDTLGSRITELYELHEQIVSTVKKESQS